jgi:tetratricopeptide (TPR) repeat protein
MRAFISALTVGAVVLAAATVGLADPQPSSRDRGRHSGRHDADSSRGDSEHSGRTERHYYGGHRHPYTPYWGGAYRVPATALYPAYPGYYPPYPAWYPPYYIPPLYLPAEELYGPRAVQRFMGVDHWFQQPQPQAQTNIVIQRDARQPAAPAAPPAEPEEPKPGRATNQQALNLARRFLGFGDVHFTNQNYAEANDRYRKAATAAPQLADSYFRQAYALLAMGRYDLSMRAIRRGMDLSADWPQSGFSNAELYGDNPQAKAAHLEALAAASEEDPHNADLLFLVGVLLHFDGKPERARPFFERANQLLAGNDAHAKAFLAE